MTDSTPRVNHPIQRVFDGHKIRVIVDEHGEPWFIGADVARALGYARPADAIAAHCKGVGEAPIPSAGGTQTAKIIPERDVYRLVMRSRLPEAERFEEWVVCEVLPSIRRTGAYSVTSAPAFDPADPRVVVAVIEAQVGKIKELEAENAAARPKVEVYDRIVDCGDTVGFRDAAKLIRAATGASENVTRGLMRKLGWIQRLDGKLAPAHVGELRGYTTTRERRFTDADGVERVRPELRITQKGVARAIEILIAEEDVA